MSRITQLALAGSVLFGGASVALAQNKDPLLQIRTSCGYIEVIEKGISKRVEDCFIQDGNGKVYRPKDGESIQIGPQLFIRKGSSIERAYNPKGYNDGREENIDKVKKCVDGVIRNGGSFDDKLACLKK